MKHDVRRLQTWGRIGYIARGLVYIIIGWLALSSNKALSTGDAIKSVRDMPAGTIILIVLIAGLFGYGLYKVVTAAADLDHDGTKSKALGKRIFRAAGGLSYWGLTFIAVRALLGDDTVHAGQASGSEGVKQDAAQQVTESSGGGTIMLLVALVVLGVAFVQLYIAAKAKFMEEMAPDSPAWVKPAGIAGYAARGIVLAVVGWFALQAGLDGERLRDFGDALAVVRKDHPLLFQLLAVGLLLFGATSIAMARYRYLRDQDITDLPDMVPGGP